MDIQDVDINNGFTGCYRYALKCCKYFFHISFLESCQFASKRPKGLIIDKSPFISFISEDIFYEWEDTINSAERQLLDILIYGINDKRLWFEENFWTELKTIVESTELSQMNDWLVSLVLDLKSEQRKCIKKKRKKIT